jgi:hypothetical protein
MATTRDTPRAGFGPPVIDQPNGPNTFPLTITRPTADGIFSLAQTFSWDTVEKDVSISATVTNLTATAGSGVRLVRYFDYVSDLNGGPDEYAFYPHCRLGGGLQGQA